MGERGLAVSIGFIEIHDRRGKSIATASAR